MAPARKLLVALAYLTVAVQGFAIPGLGDLAANRLPSRDETVQSEHDRVHHAPLPRSHDKDDGKDKHASSTSQSPPQKEDDEKKPKKPSTSKSAGGSSDKKQGSNEASSGDEKKKKTAHGDTKKKATAHGDTKKKTTAHGGTKKKGTTGSTDKAPTTGIWDADFGPYFADPALIHDGSYWYAFSTQSCVSKMAIARSKTRDPGSWHLLPGDHLPGVGTVWGPDIRKQGSEYLLMYSDSRSLWTATSSSVEGPFQQSTTLLAAGALNYIDGAFFQDPDGSLHVVYKAAKFDKTTHKHISSQIEMRQLDSAGRTTAGQVRVLQKATAQDGDHNIEAPYLVHDGSYYYLTFSTHEYAGSNYDTQYVAATSLDGLQKAARKTLLSSSTSVGGRHLDGPGGLTFAAGDAASGAVAFHNRQDPYAKGAPCSGGQNGLHRKLWLGNVHLNGGQITIA